MTDQLTAEEARVIEWLRDGLGMDDEWLGIARALVMVRKSLEPDAARPSDDRAAPEQQWSELRRENETLRTMLRERALADARPSDETGAWERLREAARAVIESWATVSMDTGVYGSDPILTHPRDYVSAEALQGLVAALANQPEPTRGAEDDHA